MARGDLLPRLPAQASPGEHSRQHSKSVPKQDPLGALALTYLGGQCQLAQDTENNTTRLPCEHNFTVTSFCLYDCMVKGLALEQGLMQKTMKSPSLSETAHHEPSSVCHWGHQPAGLNVFSTKYFQRSRSSFVFAATKCSFALPGFDEWSMWLRVCGLILAAWSFSGVNLSANW